MSKPKLGRYLEWHGNRIRVVVRVPPRLKDKFGSKLREPLVTRAPLEAEREKVDVVRRLKAKLRGHKQTDAQQPLIEQAMRWRQAALDEATATDGSEEQSIVNVALSDWVDRIEALRGAQEARQFAAIASGVATPLRALLDMWFEEHSFSVGYQEDVRRSLKRLEDWCTATSTVQSVEAIKVAVAGRFVHEQFIKPKVHATTANKDISCLRSYWQWLGKRHGLRPNPWRDQSVKTSNDRRNEGLEALKRPFTNDETRTLLLGIQTRRDWEFSLVSALSGLRIDEIGGLRVKDCQGGKFTITKSKTPSGRRTIPIHSALAAMIADRCKNKAASAYLFHELPEQKLGSKRGRSAPVTQSFSRERQRLGVDERASKKQRQSNIDFHSWRRWFIRRAAEALSGGAKGYSAWTIANVVGHKVDKGGKLDGVDLPLGLTMGRYAGKASWEEMVACVNAVALPDGAPNARVNFEDDRGRIRHRKIKLKRTLQEAAE